MATVKVSKKNKSYMYNVTSSSQDNTFIPYESALKATTSIDLNLSASDKDIFSKDGNDLVIVSIFNSANKTVTNTIKDYFKYAPTYEYFVVITQDGSWEDIVETDKSYYDYINENTVSPMSVFGTIYDQKYDEEETNVGTSKNDTYNIWNVYPSSILSYDNGENDYVYDVAGDDSYNISASHTSREHFVEVHDFKGNDKYNIQYKTNAKIYDSKGNDLYIASSQNAMVIEDLAGKDDYQISDGVTFNITDFGGNDNYSVYSSGGTLSTIKDKGGNDKYTLALGTNTSIEDSAGKDTYILTSETSDTITDNSGNDNYFATLSNDITIKDYMGKDKYDFSYSNHIDIQDGKEGETKSGNDLYNLSFIKKNDNGENYITDYSGNEKYNISNSNDLTINDKAGSDKYNLSYSSVTIVDDKNSDSYILNNCNNVKITDNGIAEKSGKKLNTKLANDKYIISDSHFAITDEEGNDTYKIKSSIYFDNMITDKKGNDKYSLSNIFQITVNDNSISADTYSIANCMSCNITDDGGKDKYNISDGMTTITDKGSSKGDTYNVKTLDSMVIIKDELGTGDILKIDGSNKNNIVFMADYNILTSADNDVMSSSLFIFDKTKSGFIELKNYFSLNPIDSSIINPSKNSGGGGYIENIYVGKAKENTAIYNYTTSADFAELSAQVASWKSEFTGYNSVGQILSSDNIQDISKFITLVSQNC